MLSTTGKTYDDSRSDVPNCESDKNWQNSYNDIIELVLDPSDGVELHGRDAHSFGVHGGNQGALGFVIGTHRVHNHAVPGAHSGVAAVPVAACAPLARRSFALAPFE